MRPWRTRQTELGEIGLELGRREEEGREGGDGVILEKAKPVEVMGEAGELQAYL